MTFDMQPEIRPPALKARDRATLVTTAHPLSELLPDGFRGWTGGVKFVPLGVDEAENFDGGFGDVTKGFQEIPDTQFFYPIRIVAGEQCSAMSMGTDELLGRVMTRLDAFESLQLSTELYHGGSNDSAASCDLGVNHFITESTGLLIMADEVDAQTPSTALASLERGLQNILNGAVGTIHLTPGLLAVLDSNGLLQFYDGRYYTATGHVVIADAGFEGLGPDNDVPATAGVEWAYATGPVYFAIADVPDVIDFEGERTDITRNNVKVLGEKLGIAVYDHNVRVAVAVAFDGAAAVS